MRHVLPALAALLALAVAVPAAAEPYRPVLMYESPEASDDHHAGHSQYPDLSKASAAERRNARGVMAKLRRIADEQFPTLDAAIARGYEDGARMRFIGQEHKISNSVHSPFVHFNKRAYNQDGRVFDLRRPESLVYWQNPAGDPVLVGFMFRAPAQAPPPDPHAIGSIPIWHAHAICDAEREPGNPLQFESEPCPTGLAHHGDNQMTHVWLTDDVRTGYAMEVPARTLNIFIEGVPALYAGDGPEAAAGHDHAGGGAGDGHDHAHAATLTATDIVAANAWTVSLVAPAVGAVLLLLRRRRLDRAGARLVGIVCLGGVAATHASDLAAHASETTYLAVGFCLLIAAAAALAVALGAVPRAGPAWALAGGLAATAMIGYVLSRTVGLPQIEDHVGHWDTAGVLSLIFESLLVTLALALVADAGAVRVERARPRPAAALRRERP